MNLADHVRQTIAAHHLIRHDEKLVLGVSGGPDSLALLHILRALSGEWQTPIHIAHLNHQLRGAESIADAEFVASIAHAWNLPATIESRDVAAYARERKCSLEEAAREMRYAFLVDVAQSVDAHTIVVAHNADDQAETVLMHLLRGAGMAGLRGMEYKLQIANDKLQIIRPLLDVTRAEVEAYCVENALAPRIDSTNADTTLFRNRLRHEALPYLETLNPNVREILRHTSRALADDYDFLQSQAREAFGRVARADAPRSAIIFAREAWRELHPSLQRATLRLAFEQLRGDYRNLAWTHIEDARTIALSKNTGAEATLPRGLTLTVGYGEFFIAAEMHQMHFDLPQLKVERLALPSQGTVGLPKSRWSVETVILSPEGAKNLVASNMTLRFAQGDNWLALFDAQKISGEIFLRARKPGDKFQPIGMNGHTKSLHEFMIDEKIPQGTRARLPLLCDSEKILGVCGYRADERARVTDATHEILCVTLRKAN